MKQEQVPGAMLGMYASDADLFRRIWERVGAEERADCPVERTSVPGAPEGIRKGETGNEDCVSGEGWNAAMQAPAAEEQAKLLRTAKSEASGDDFPPPDEFPCLGRASAPQGGTLQQYIREELEGWQLYRHLARRVGGPNARTLTVLASEKHRRARRLAAAHFLIAGVRYWPTDRLETPRLNSWLGVLRERFGTEQRQEHRYRAAACDTADPCLAELYSELAEECAQHAAVVRAVLESAL